MKFITGTMKWLLAVSIFLTIAACSDNTEQANAQQLIPENIKSLEQTSHQTVSLDVYKSPTCGCCEDWIEHIETAGFDASIHHPEDIKAVKQSNAIAPPYHSCHTAVSKQGYVFEGHVPAHLIQRFLANPPPNAIGLAVPGMPIGSPGMEMGDRYDSYNVLLLKNDGSAEVYAAISGKN